MNHTEFDSMREREACVVLRWLDGSVRASCCGGLVSCPLLSVDDAIAALKPSPVRCEGLSHTT